MLKVKPGDRAVLQGFSNFSPVMHVVGRSSEEVEQELGGGPRWYVVCLTPMRGCPPLMQAHVLEAFLRPLPPIREEDVTREKFRISLLRVKRYRELLRSPPPASTPRPRARKPSRDGLSD